MTIVTRLSLGETGEDPVIVDASVSETHIVSGEVSDHPVESGIDIVDNYRVLPRQLQFDAVVSDSPLPTDVVGASDISSGDASARGDSEPSKNALQEIERFFDEAVVLTIITSLREYTNMVLTEVSITRDSNTGNGLFFTASAREVKFVDTERGAAIALPKTTTGQKKKSAGSATNADANSSQSEQSQSTLSQFIFGAAS